MSEEKKDLQELKRKNALLKIFCNKMDQKILDMQMLVAELKKS